MNKRDTIHPSYSREFMCGFWSIDIPYMRQMSFEEVLKLSPTREYDIFLMYCMADI
jgi:hypothetical protein